MIWLRTMLAAVLFIVGLRVGLPDNAVSGPNIAARVIFGAASLAGGIFLLAISHNNKGSK